VSELASLKQNFGWVILGAVATLSIVLLILLVVLKDIMIIAFPLVVAGNYYLYKVTALSNKPLEH